MSDKLYRPTVLSGILSITISAFSDSSLGTDRPLGVGTIISDSLSFVFELPILPRISK